MTNQSESNLYMLLTQATAEVAQLEQHLEGLKDRLELVAGRANDAHARITALDEAFETHLTAYHRPC